jgi:anti-sigma factor RsiW
MKCAEAQTFVHVYVDGEFAGPKRQSYEQHLLVCAECLRASRLQARFKAAVRGHLGRKPVPEHLEARVRAPLGAEKPIPVRRWPWQIYPRLAPAAAAAIALLVIVVGFRGRTSAVMMQAQTTFAAALPLDIRDSNRTSIADWFRGRVDFSLQPPSLGDLATCQGGRLVNVRDRLAVYLAYQGRNGHRVGMIVFEGQGDDIDGERRRVLGGQDVYFATGRGVSTAAFRGRDGLYYVVTTDTDEDALSGYVNAVFEQRR